MQSALTICLLAVLPTAARAQIAALEPAGDLAAQTLAITNVLFIGGGVIFAAVMLALGMAMLGPARLRAALSHRRWLVGAGIVFPVAVLSALLVYTFSAASAMVTGQQAPAARIEVAAELWWWRVRYLDARGKALFETANEIRIPAGEPVQLELVSPNVIHSFWVPALAGKIDMIPGRVNRMRLRATAPGTYRGQCAEYCGGQHAKMAFHVVALARDEYAGWFARRREGTAGAAQPLAAPGRDLFAGNGCGLCHTVSGTDAAGTIGPDLTDVGSRAWLAGGTLPNTRANMAHWISDSQALKPGSRMPAYRQFSAEELAALADYLGSLR